MTKADCVPWRDAQFLSAPCGYAMCLFYRTAPIARRARRVGFQVCERDDDVDRRSLLGRPTWLRCVLNEIRLDCGCAVMVAPCCLTERTRPLQPFFYLRAVQGKILGSCGSFACQTCGKMSGSRDLVTCLLLDWLTVTSACVGSD